MHATAGPLRVEPGRNGGVEVYGWDRDSVAVVAKIQANARHEADARRIAEAVRIEASGRLIRAAGPTQSRENWAVVFEVYVPRHTDLSLDTVNGPMDLAFPLTVTIQGRVTNHIQSTLGDGGAPVRIVTTNGPLSIRRAR